MTLSLSYSLSQLRTINPAETDNLEEDDNEQWDATGGEVVHQLEDPHAALSDHRQAEKEVHQNDKGREELSTRPEETRPLVDDARHKWLHRAELTVNAQHEEHDEEEHGPDVGRRQTGHRLGVDDEG